MTDEPDGGRPAADPAEVRFQAALIAALRDDPAASPDAQPLSTTPAWVAPTGEPGAAPARRRWVRQREPAAPTADWAWVEEWREGDEPTPWGPGLALAGFAALIIGIAVYVISAGLSDRPWIAVVANVVVAAGLAPALWMSRHLPVLRWISLGGAVGTVVAWVSVLFFPNF